MNNLDLSDLLEFVNVNIVDFHQRRIRSLEGLDLDKLLKKNPYLIKSKVIARLENLLFRFGSRFFQENW